MTRVYFVRHAQPEHEWEEDRTRPLTEEGTYTSTVSIREADKANAILRIPQDAAGKELHIICEVTDNGTPALTSYRRVIIRPKLGETFNLSGQR